MFMDKEEKNSKIENEGQIIILKDNASAEIIQNKTAGYNETNTKNKKKSHLGRFLILVVSIFFCAFLGLYERLVYSGVIYEESVLTPIYYYYSMQYMDAREYAKECSEEVWDYGCILNIYLTNKNNNPITVSESSIFVDSIIKNDQSIIYVIGDYSNTDNTLTLYAINNGLGNFEHGQICISVNHFNEENNSSEYLTEEQISYLFEGKNVIEIDNLVGGEIRKLAKYTVNKTYVKELDLLSISYMVIDSNKEQTKKGESIGLLGYTNSGIYFSISEGDFSDIVVERALTIDVDYDEGKELKIPANFVIGENNLKNVLYALYPTSSCEITFHAIFKCAGEKKEIETEKFTQEIYVPLYKEDGGIFDSVREFIKKYNIDTYYYDSNPIIQKEIDYVPMQSME